MKVCTTVFQDRLPGEKLHRIFKDLLAVLMRIFARILNKDLQRSSRILTFLAKILKYTLSRSSRTFEDLRQHL